MFHGKVCKHATALALYTIRHPTTETKGETQNDAPKPFNQKALAEKLADLNKAPYRELKKIAFCDFANRWLQTTPKER
jgi:hypothetical protein